MMKYIFLILIINTGLSFKSEAKERCMGNACISFSDYDDKHKSVTIKPLGNKGLLCFTRYDGRGYTYWLEKGAKTFYIPNEYPLSSISWRCDVVVKQCPKWSHDYCLRYKKYSNLVFSN
jgi:hypothetical protein